MHRQFEFAAIETEEFHNKLIEEDTQFLQEECQSRADESGTISQAHRGDGLVYIVAIPNKPYVRYGSKWHKVVFNNLSDKKQPTTTTACNKTYDAYKCKYADEPKITKSTTLCKKCGEK